MFHLHRPEAGDGDDDNPFFSSSQTTFTINGNSGLQTPSMDNTTYVLIFLVVFIPVIFTIILCTITYCVYRYNKKRSERAPTNSPIVPADRFGVSTATVIYNTQHSPYIFEELPPSYDSLTDIKKHPHDRPTNTNEELQLTVLPNTTLTNTNDEVTSAAILPTAPTPPPPFYIDLNESNK